MGAKGKIILQILFFDILLYFYTYLCTTFLWPLRLGSFLVLSLYKEGYYSIF